jgi:hypothetical protein
MPSVSGHGSGEATEQIAPYLRVSSEVLRSNGTVRPSRYGGSSWGNTASSTGWKWRTYMRTTVYPAHPATREAGRKTTPGGRQTGEVWGGARLQAGQAGANLARHQRLETNG